MHVIAGKAVAFKEALEPEFKTYQAQVVKNAKAMAATFIERGYKIVSGGTDNHLMLVDLIYRELTGKEADAALGKANITVNKNSVPNDPRSVRHLRCADRYPGHHPPWFQGSRVHPADQLDL